jgi:hypothetical protein
MVKRTARTTLKAPPSSAGNTVRPSALGAPALLLGEEAEVFEALLARVTAAVKPADAIEEVWVRDIVELACDMARLRRFKASLLQVAAPDGLRRVLNPLVDRQEANRLSEAWGKRDAEARTEVERLLARANCTADAIMAETLTLKLDQIERFERLIATAEARLAGALRELDRRRAVLAQAVREAADDIVDAEFEDLAPQDALPGPSA